LSSGRDLPVFVTRRSDSAVAPRRPISKAGISKAEEISD
jgi:hypothetical protein